MNQLETDQEFILRMDFYHNDRIMGSVESKPIITNLIVLGQKLDSLCIQISSKLDNQNVPNELKDIEFDIVLSLINQDEIFISIPFHNIMIKEMNRMFEYFGSQVRNVLNDMNDGTFDFNGIKENGKVETNQYQARRMFKQ
tara:strand:+ start:39 stop:461 length:423 start_codon:yes stop_codon:yes gene_type:complete